MVFLPKLYDLILILRKHRTSLNLGTFYKINGLYIFKGDAIKDEERLRNHSSFKKIKEIKQPLNAMCGSKLDFGPENKLFFFSYEGY